MSELIERLRNKAQTTADFNKSHGRKGPEWAVGLEVEWQAADTLASQAARIAELEAQLAEANKRAGLAELLSEAHADDTQDARAFWKAAEARLAKAVEAGTMARTRLFGYAGQANAGEVQAGGRELARKVWAAFSEFDAVLSELEVAWAPKS